MVAIILLPDPLLLSGSNKDRGLLWSGVHEEGAAEVGGISAYCASGDLREFMSANNLQNSEGDLSLHGPFVDPTTNNGLPPSKKPSL